MSDADQSSFAADAWTRIEGWRDAVETMPFIRALADGSLSSAAFGFYLGQDAIYLREFARALSTASSLAPNAAAQAFFAASAHAALDVEASLHRDWLRAHIGDVAADPSQGSPVTIGYTNHLLAACARGAYPVLVAAVLPCYWLYAHIGSVLIGRAGNLDEHPYGRWIATYADPDFQMATDTARSLADTAATHADPESYAGMLHAFERSAMYEYLFFEQGLNPSAWPNPPASA